MLAQYAGAARPDQEKERRRAALKAERDRLRQQLASRDTAGGDAPRAPAYRNDPVNSAFALDSGGTSARPPRRYDERERLHRNTEDESIRELKVLRALGTPWPQKNAQECRQDKMIAHAAQAKVAASQMEAERAAAMKIDAERRGGGGGGGMPTQPPQELQPYPYQYSSPALGASGAVGLPPQFKPAAVVPAPVIPPAPAECKAPSSSDTNTTVEGLRVASNALALGAGIAKVALAF